jgi:hypothetical protein
MYGDFPANSLGGRIALSLFASHLAKNACWLEVESLLVVVDSTVAPAVLFSPEVAMKIVYTSRQKITKFKFFNPRDFLIIKDDPLH